MSSLSNLEVRYRRVLGLIEEAIRRANRSDQAVLIAVSKGQSQEKILELYRLGHRDFGENYVQELMAKAKWARDLGLDEIRWHLIGHLQRNKVKQVLPFVSAFHALDSVALAKEIIRHLFNRIPQEQRLKVFIQINADDEGNKSGVSFSEAERLVREVLQLEGASRIELAGLMAIPNPQGDVARSFARLKTLSGQLGEQTLGFLSMGMSEDFELALAEGASHLRIGTALFGPRG